MIKHSTIETFAKDFVDIMKSYTDDVVEGITTEAKDTAETGAEMLRNVRMPDASKSGSARPMKRRQWNRYSNSWAVKEREGTNFYHASIHNKRHYRLTHLLEYGHATRNGTTTRAFRHIEPIDIYCVERIEKNIPKIIKKGGKL